MSPPYSPMKSESRPTPTAAKIKVIKEIIPAIIERTRPAVAMPLVFPFFLAIAANIIPTIAHIKEKIGTHNDNTPTIPKTSDIIAIACDGCSGFCGY